MLVGNQWFWVVSFMGANLFVHGAKEAAISKSALLVIIISAMVSTGYHQQYSRLRTGLRPKG